ncbi:hypothetical protein [Mesorhizobium sp. M0060]|uniref:hypothetical protein n=1 Tax=Mesorhizobium sp. M0060 TaxID=2956866 RepID=UPI0033374EF6
MNQFQLLPLILAKSTSNCQTCGYLATDAEKSIGTTGLTKDFEENLYILSEATQLTLMYFILPSCLVAGFADWLFISLGHLATGYHLATIDQKRRLATPL